MTDQKSGTRSSVGLLDIASRVPGLLPTRRRSCAA